MDPAEQTDAEQGPPASGGMRQLLDYNNKLRASLRELKTEHSSEKKALEEQLAETQAKHLVELNQARESSEELTKLSEELKALQQGKNQLEKDNDSLGKQMNALKTAQKSRHAKLSQEREETDKTRRELESIRSAKGKLEDDKFKLEEQVASLQAAGLENDGLKSQISGLNATINRISSAKEQVEKDLETLRQESTAQRCHELETDNLRLTNFAKECEQAMLGAQKRMEEAEKTAFESRNKLLTLYAAEESKEILSNKVKELEIQLESKSLENVQLAADLEESLVRCKKIEEQVLFSSDRDSLKRSLASLAKKRSLSDSGG